jgi:hypothetical protein
MAGPPRRAELDEDRLDLLKGQEELVRQATFSGADQRLLGWRRKSQTQERSGVRIGQTSTSERRKLCQQRSFFGCPFRFVDAPSS